MKYTVKQILRHSTCQLLLRSISHVLLDQFKTLLLTKSICRVLYYVPFRHSVTGISIRHGIAHHAQQTLWPQMRITLRTNIRVCVSHLHSSGQTNSQFPLYFRSLSFHITRTEQAGEIRKAVLWVNSYCVWPLRWAILFRKKRAACGITSTSSQEPRVGIVTRLRGGQPKMRASVTSRGKRLLPFSKYPDQLLGTPSLTFKKYLETLLPAKAAGTSS